MAGGRGGVMNWEIGIDIYTLICIKWITNKNLLYKKINKIRFKKIIKRIGHPVIWTPTGLADHQREKLSHVRGLK